MSDRGGEDTMGEVPIRRLDWRFLLPEPGSRGGAFSDLIVLGGSSGLEARALELGVAGEVRAGTDDQAAELVVVLAGAEVGVDEVAARVRPGGVVYWEVDRSRSGNVSRTPARFSRQLANAGLDAISVHACLPDFEKCKLLLPLDVPEALRWYLSSLFPSDTFPRRLLSLALRGALGGDGRRAAGLIPTYGVTAVQRAFAGERVPAVLGDRRVPSRLRTPGTRVVVLTDAGNRVALLPIGPGAPDPGAVLKVPKVAQVNDRTENEHRRLKELRRGLPPRLAERMPEPVELFQREGIAISVESFLPGRSILASSGAWARSWKERHEDLRQAASWIADFHRDARIERRPWGGEDVAKWVDGALDAYRQAFGFTDAEAKLFSAWRESAVELEGRPFPLVWHHRDFNVWNIFRAKGGVSVIDWEGVRPGPALCDLLHFVTHWHETVLHVEGEEARLKVFRELYFGGAHRRSRLRTSRAVGDAIQHYTERLDLDSRFVPVLLVYTWVELALRRRKQQEDMGELPALARAGNRNFPYIEILAEETASLFGPGAPGPGVVGQVRG